ncbi:hypothetical protein V6Z11_A08G187300 [Gossypium hirsutum]
MSYRFYFCKTFSIFLHSHQFGSSSFRSSSVPSRISIKGGERRGILCGSFVAELEN